MKTPFSPNSAFTLVELIVVITILSILSAIGFVSYQGYTESARDTGRMSDVTNIHQALELFSSKGSPLPIPANTITLIASGSLNIVGYQWDATKSILSLLGVAEAKDPKTGNPYTYTITTNKDSSQVASLLEASPTNSIFSKGSSLGILFASGTTNNSFYTLNPTAATIIPLNSTTTSTSSIDIALTNTGYTAVFGSDTSNRITGTWVNLITSYSSLTPDGKIFAQYDTSLVGYWDMQTLTSDGKLKDLSRYGNDGVCHSPSTIGSDSAGSSSSIVSCNTSGSPEFRKDGVYFSGSGNYIDMGDANILEFGTHNLSMVTRVQPDNYLPTGSWDHMFISKIDLTSPRHGYFLSVRGDQDVVYDSSMAWKRGTFMSYIGGGLWWGGAQQELHSLGWVKSDGLWHSVIVVNKRNSNASMFSDGSVSASDISAVASQDETNAKHFVLGRNDASASQFQGTIGVVKIYNRALTDEEANLYNK